MNIKSSLAAQQYVATRPHTAPKAEAGADASLSKLAQDFSAVLENGDATAQQAMVGKADGQALVQALSQTQLAVETAVTIRDKVVEAYQEILRMPV